MKSFLQRSSSANGRSLSNDELGDLYRTYYPRVYNHVYYRLLNRECTEDLVSEVFVKVVRNLDGFDSTKASFGTWLFHITRNTLIDHYRKPRNLVMFDDAGGFEPIVEDDYTGLDEHAMEVRHLLALLDEADRELVFLKYHEEMKNSEIAQLLNMNASTVSTRLSRALRTMQQAVHSPGGRVSV